MKHSIVALDAGISPETLSRILTSQHQRPSLDTVCRIAHAANENVGWILGEDGFELSADEWVQLSKVVRFLQEGLFKSPPPHTVVAPRPNALRLPSRARDIPTAARALGARLVLQVIDDSLRDAGVLDGDLILARPGSDPLECVGSLIACEFGGELWAKQLARAGGRLRLLSRNERYAPIDVHPEDLNVLGVVVGRSGPIGS